MSGANVKAISALNELRTALLRFRSDAGNSLDAMRNASIRTIEWLQSRLQYWQRELERRLLVLQKAQKALNDCVRASQQAANNGRGGFDCNEYAAAVYAAKRAVEEAQQELNTAKSFLKAVQEAFDNFQREGQQLSQVISHDLMQGTNLLQRSSDYLSRYATSGGGSAGGSFGGGTGGGGGGGSSVAPGLSAVQPGDRGAFSISDWSGYPSSLPRPPGPFRILQGEDYSKALSQAAIGRYKYRAAHPEDAADKDAHHIHPVKFGGDPIDPSNFVLLTPEEHKLYSDWWRELLIKAKRSGGIL